MWNGIGLNQVAGDEQNRGVYRNLCCDDCEVFLEVAIVTVE